MNSHKFCEHKPSVHLKSLQVNNCIVLFKVRVLITSKPLGVGITIERNKDFISHANRFIQWMLFIDTLYTLNNKLHATWIMTLLHSPNRFLLWLWFFEFNICCISVLVMCSVGLTLSGFNPCYSHSHAAAGKMISALSDIRHQQINMFFKHALLCNDFVEVLFDNSHKVRQFSGNTVGGCKVCVKHDHYDINRPLR